MEKKRRVVSYEGMDPDLAAAFEEKYPRGFADYMPDINKYEKPDGTVFHAVTIETESCIALVKVQIKTDNADDLERWLDSESGEGVEGESANEGEEGGTDIPDDISQYGGEEDAAE